MGAAGLTCSTCEMGARGGAGIEIDVQHVPQRETGMTPYEIMLSESQERMLLVGEARTRSRSRAHLRQVGPARRAHRRRHRRRPDAGEEPRRGRRRDSEHARWWTRRRSTTGRRRGRPTWTRCARLDLDGAAAVVAARGAARAPRRADHRQQALGLPPVRPHGPHQHAGARGHGRRRRPHQGNAAGAGDVDRRQRPLLLSRSARRARCSPWPRPRATSPVPAALPIGATNCLNFGNPEKPEIMWQLVEAVEGIAEACRALDVPITGGNVSLYNETDGNAHLSDPHHRRGRRHRRCVGDAGARRSAPPAATSCCSAKSDGRPGRQRVPQDACTAWSPGEAPVARPGRANVRSSSCWSRRPARRLIESAHDCPTAALAVTLAECTFDSGGIGCTVDLPGAAGHAGRLGDAWHAVRRSRRAASSSRSTPVHREALQQLAARDGRAAERRSARPAAPGFRSRSTGQRPSTARVAEAEQLWSSTLGKYFEGRAA